MTSSITFAFDDNLGYPDGILEHIERTVSRRGDITCDPLSFHDLDEMISAFTQGAAQLMFLPCGCFPYISVPLKVLAQATVGEGRSTRLTSVMLAGSDVEADGVLSVATSRFGCINKFCTTSYWGPQFLEYAQGAPRGAPEHLVWVHGFDDLVESLEDGRAEVAMVWEPYREKHADQTREYTELGRLADLPAPLVVADPTLDSELLSSLGNLAPFSSTGDSLFNGLAAPDRKGIEAFLSLIRTVQPDSSLASAIW